MTFLIVNGYIASDVKINDVQMGIWLEMVVNRQMTFETFVERLRQRISQQDHG